MSDHLLSIIITVYSGTDCDLFIKYLKYFFYEENNVDGNSPWVINKPDNESSYVYGVYDLNYKINITDYNYEELKDIEFILVIDNKKDISKEIDLNEYNNKEMIDLMYEKDLEYSIFIEVLKINDENTDRFIKKFINEYKYINDYYSNLYQISRYKEFFHSLDHLSEILRCKHKTSIENNEELKTKIEIHSKILYFFKNAIDEIFYIINTNKIIQQFKLVMRTVKHTNYKIIYSNEPSSLSTSRNIGAKESKGDWLMFFDDDDPHVNIECIYNLLIEFKDKNVYYYDECDDGFPCDVIWCATKNQDIAIWGKFYKREVFETFNNNCNYYDEDIPFNELVNAYFRVYDCYDEIDYAIISYERSDQYELITHKFIINGEEINVSNEIINYVYLAMNFKRIIDLYKDDKENYKFKLFKNHSNINNILIEIYNYLFNDNLANYYTLEEEYINTCEYIKSDEFKMIINYLKEVYYNQNQVCSFTVIEPNKDPYKIYHSVGNSDERVENYLSEKYNYIKNDDKEINMNNINSLLAEHKLNTMLLGGFISLILLLLKITILIIIVSIIVLIFKQVKISSEN